MKSDKQLRKEIEECWTVRQSIGHDLLRPCRRAWIFPQQYRHYSLRSSLESMGSLDSLELRLADAIRHRTENSFCLPKASLHLLQRLMYGSFPPHPNPPLSPVIPRFRRNTLPVYAPSRTRSNSCDFPLISWKRHGSSRSIGTVS